jgi:hypothetical protein
VAILNFPPATGSEVGKTYEANGVLYTWDGYKWEANSESAFDDKYVNIDGDTMTGDLTVPSLNGGPLGGFRNQIINANFYFWNRGSSFSVTDGSTSSADNGYTADRWKCSVAGGASATVAINASGPVSAGLQYAIENRGPDIVALQQGVELRRKESNLQFAIGSQWTLSFWSTEDQTSNASNVKWKVGVRDNGVLVSSTMPNFQSTGETANGFTRYAATFTVTVNANTVTDSNCLAVVLSMSNGNRISGVQLEPGPVATPFEHRPIATEIALCQRYFFRAPNNYLVISTDSIVSGESYANTAQLPVPMRATPTASDFTSVGGSGELPTPSTFNQASNVSVGISVTATATIPAKSFTRWIGFDADAEL